MALKLNVARVARRPILIKANNPIHQEQVDGLYLIAFI